MLQKNIKLILALTLTAATAIFTSGVKATEKQYIDASTYVDINLKVTIANCNEKKHETYEGYKVTMYDHKINYGYSRKYTHRFEVSPGYTAGYSMSHVLVQGLRMEIFAIPIIGNHWESYIKIEDNCIIYNPDTVTITKVVQDTDTTQYNLYLTLPEVIY